MLSRKAIECALVMLCFVTIACSEGDGEVQNSSQNKSTESSQEANENLRRMKESLAAASTAVGRAQTALNDPTPTPDRRRSSPAPKPSQPARGATSPSSTRAPATSQVTVELPDLTGALNEVKGAITNLEQANESLDSLSSALIGGTVAGETHAALGEVETNVKNARSKLLGVADELAAAPAEVGENTSKAAYPKSKTDLPAVQLALKSATAAAARIIVPANLAAPPSFFSQLLSDWGATIAIALGALFGLVLLALGAKALVRSMGAEFERQLSSGVKPALAGIQKQQKDFATQLSALASNNNGVSTRMGEIQTEVRSLGRLIRDASLNSGARRASASADPYPTTDQPSPRDEPVFPISTVDYLGKTQGMALVVKPDFQNGILVTDPDGKGELALIRDSKVHDDMHCIPVVPRAATFQTKQDFHTYYEKYYDCTRPSAGEVWIVEPAVVSKVQGGWQLRKKGVLEIR
jgi:hypothetical protein